MIITPLGYMDYETLCHPRLPRLVADTLGTGAVSDELSAILAARFRTFREDETALPLDKRSGRGIYGSVVGGPHPRPGAGDLDWG